MKNNYKNDEHNKIVIKKKIRIMLLCILSSVGIIGYIFKLYPIMVVCVLIGIIISIIMDFSLYNKSSKSDKVFLDNNYDNYSRAFIDSFLSQYADNIELNTNQNEAINNFKQTIFNKYNRVDTYDCSMSSKLKLQNYPISLSYLTASYIRYDAGNNVDQYEKIEMFKGFFVEIDFNKDTNSNIVITEYKSKLEMPLFKPIPFRGYKKIGLNKIANIYTERNNVDNNINNNFITKYCELLNNFKKDYNFKILNYYAKTEPIIAINIDKNKMYLIIRAENYINNLNNSVEKNEENFVKYDSIIKFIIDVTSIVHLI